MLQRSKQRRVVKVSTVQVRDLVHENCRAKHSNKKSLDLIIRGKVSDSPVHPKTRSSDETTFYSKTHCLYFKKSIITSSKHAKHPKLD